MDDDQDEDLLDFILFWWGIFMVAGFIAFIPYYYITHALVCAKIP